VTEVLENGDGTSRFRFLGWEPNDFPVASGAAVAVGILVEAADTSVSGATAHPDTWNMSMEMENKLFRQSKTFGELNDSFERRASVCVRSLLSSAWHSIFYPNMAS
jgi:hypothetical protein